MPPLFVVLVLGVFAQTLADEPEPIVGGTSASPGQFPYQVSLRSGSHFCGGTLINSNCVVTAAHCLHGVVPPPYNGIQVVAGHLHSYGGELRAVKSAAIHPRYSGTSSSAWEYDAAVIKLAKPVERSSTINWIGLASQKPSPGTNCVVSGWGKTSTNSGVATFLLYAYTSVVSYETCKSYHNNMPINNFHLCCYARYGVGACQGDSGGPLVCNNQLAGIVSWVLPCAVGYPDAFCDVTEVRQWLLDTCASL